MESVKYPNFLTLGLSANYIQRWNCDTENKTHSNVYFNCLSGQGQIELISQCKYHGQIKDGYLEGRGAFSWPTGVKYEGDFRESRITGAGKFIWPDGSFYEGQIIDGKRHGQGVFYCASEKYVYSGEWKQGLKEGKGRIQYQDQSVYEGGFQNDQRHGLGKMVYPSKNEYEGMWRNDKKEGKGTMNWASAHEKYVGSWKQDKPDGYGEYFWYENKTQFKIFKNTYKGFWKEGKRSGFGSFYYCNGYRFEGFFHENLKEGSGMIIDQYGSSKLQQYSNDRPLQNIPKGLSKQNLSEQLNKEGLASQGKFPLLSLKNHSKQDSSVSQNKQPKSQGSFQNQYRKFIDFEHAEVNENFYNLLLRNNSKLRNLYKSIGVSNTHLKDFYSGMVLENYWKALRQCRLLSENYSLVAIDRLLSKGRKFYFDVGLPDPAILDTQKKQHYDEKTANYWEILWYDYFQKLRNQVQLNWSSMKMGWEGDLRPPVPLPVDIHYCSNIILYRHFICLVVHTAILLDESKKPLKDKVQSLISSLEHFNDPNFKEKCQDSCTQAGSAKAIVVPEWVKLVHEGLIYQIESRVKKYNGQSELSMPVRELYSVLEKGNIFKDVNEKILYLERIERYLNIKNSPLKKQHRILYPEVEKCIKNNPNFGYLMNYEMNLKQIHEFLFVCLSKKFVATNQDDFQNKYKEVVRVLIAEVQESKRNSIMPTKLICRRNETEKDTMKRQLIAQAQTKKLREIEEQKQRMEAEKERQERELMGREDYDAEDIILENEESDDYFG